MTNFIPIFPLEIVVYPSEQLHLHIFEPRYKQLINDCYTNSKPFGIPTVLNNGIAEMGTLVSITKFQKCTMMVKWISKQKAFNSSAF